MSSTLGPLMNVYFFVTINWVRSLRHQQVQKVKLKKVVECLQPWAAHKVRTQNFRNFDLTKVYFL